MPESMIQGVPGATGTNTETVAIVSNTVNYQTAPSLQGLKIAGTVNITAGAGTTAVVLKIRRGSGLTGNVIGPVPAGVSHTLAAGATAQIHYSVLDTAPTPTPLTTDTGADSPPLNIYTLTVQQTGGTGAGTMNYASIGMTPAATGW